MQIFSKLSLVAQEQHRDERGAALISALLISLLILAAGGALIVTTATSATNAIDATAEAQAYYAAESGMQSALHVLRGNVAPNPLFNASSATAPENKITFRQAVSTPSLSRWITYNNTYSRVTLSDSYAPISGMAYRVSVNDPDNTQAVIFDASGAFPANSNASSITVGTGNGNRFTLTYSPPSTNPATITVSGSAPFGSFRIATSSAFAANDISQFFANGIDFNLTISQTSPLPATSASPQVVVIPCKITGTVSSNSSLNTVRITFPTLTNNVYGTTYTRATTTFTIAHTGTTTISPVTITAPEPARLLVKVTGYGPRAAEKRMQMIVSRSAFGYKPNAAITLRGSNSSLSPMPVFNIGSSSQYRYNGYDNAGGAGLPAFVVTNSPDYTTGVTNTSGNTQVTGTSQVQQAPLSDLATFLQTAQGARDAVSLLRNLSKDQFYPLGTEGDANDRYFPAGSIPSTLGTESNPLVTFVDGNVVIPPEGGAGLLVVTGILDMTGRADFKGLILVLGTGTVLRNGGGNGVTLGSMVVASFGATGDFLAPSFDSNGGGTADLFYDSKWVERALLTIGPGVRGVSEY